MKYLLFTVATTAIIFYLIPDATSELLKRCQSVCSRSDGQDFCQRCRMRVPMRFGKRMELSNDVTGQKKGMGQQLTEEDDSGYEDSSRESGNGNVRDEARLLLDSMKNFAKDLENWNREMYDE